MDICQVKVGRPQFVDGGEEMHIQRIAVIVWNKQSQTADKG
jgi:hypothetical protein